MSFSSKEISHEFSKNKIGLVGIAILGTLFVLSAIAVVTIPIESFKEWDDPAGWLTFPKSALPAWVNYFLPEKMPEHMILQNTQPISQNVGNVFLTSSIFGVNYNYDKFPSDFIYEYTAKYTGSPLLQIWVTRPDV